ncbi:uncharacterized protein LOC126672243 [Mercurialis annua]|uniref:uncharacterized protein LOC126672243 n=1 Tax=Mercurialis annua TaxID=3986 RepID=UPI00215F2691|nr:uncharacterized protein LOC126672243 [Mercurialis annua]
MQNMPVAAVQASCDLCGQLGHNSFECFVAAPSDTEQVNFVGAQGQGGGGNNSYSKTYNPGWRNHPNFTWSNSANNAPRPAQGPPRFQIPPPPQDRLGAFESKMYKFMESITNRFNIQDENQKKLEEKFDHITKNQSSVIHDLEVHFCRMANTIATRNPESLPSHTENPRDVKAMTLRSGKELESSFNNHEKTTVHEKEMKIEEEQEVDIPLKKYVPPPPFVPKIPFPQRLKKEQNDQQFANFLDKVKKLQINLSLAETLEQMPKYAKFLKDILTNKRKWTDDGTISLIENFSSIISKKIPTKLKDPGSFTIPCVDGDMEFSRCLCDLGARINLMPLSIFQKFSLGEVKETSIILQLPDQSSKQPYGIIEDVLVKVDKFIFPVDFVVLDFEEDKNCPLILGRPFMNTGRVLIDVHDKKIDFRNMRGPS